MENKYQPREDKDLFGTVTNEYRVHTCSQTDKKVIQIIEFNERGGHGWLCLHNDTIKKDERLADEFLAKHNAIVDQSVTLIEPVYPNEEQYKNY